MHFDDLLKVLGEFGLYQKIRFFLLCLFSIVSAWHSFNMVFIGAVPKYHCDVTGINLSITAYQNMTEQKKEIIFLPKDDKCSAFNTTQSLYLWEMFNYNITHLAQIAPNRTTMSCPDGLHFSKDMYKSTIVSEFELVCDKKFWRSTSKSVYFFGRLCGAVLFGQVSDKFGRRPTFFVGILLLLIAGCLSAASPNMYMFLPMYFLQGTAQTGAFLVAYTLASELVGPSYRVLVGFVIQAFYSLGFMSLAGLAYFVREWRYLEIAITIPSVLFFLYYWFLPESVRWLLSQEDRDKEAERIIMAAAKTNKVSINSDVILALKKGQTSNDKKYYFFDLLRTWPMAKLSLNIWFNWLINALVYYGLSLNTENLAGSPYINFCIAGAVEIPAFIVCILLLDRVGRRIPLVAAMFIGGIACILSGTLPTDGDDTMTTVTVVLAMVGKFGITASYAIIYLMAAELFPTVLRNIGMGMSSMSARIGGILAPQLLDLSSISAALPMLLFGSLSILAGSMALLLPEPMGKPLPQTIEDVQKSSGCFSSRKKKREDVYEKELTVTSDI